MGTFSTHRFIMKNTFFIIGLIIIVFSCTPPRTASDGLPRKLQLALGAPEYVTELNLPRKGITELPPEIGKLVNLKRLNLFRNNLTSLPPEIGQLKNLEVLMISGNKLTKLPPEIGELKNLKYLSVKFNDLTELPPEIGQLSQLETLDLQNNRLEELPDEMYDLSSLEFLYLGNNSLSHLSSRVGELTELQHFYLGRNVIPPQILPASLGNLSNLRELDIALSGSMLRLPETLSNVGTLEYLYVDNTTILPISINRLYPYLQVITRN